MHIDELIKQVEYQQTAVNQISELVIPNNWAQGRTVYGGLTAGLIFQSMQQVVVDDRPDEARPVRYLNISFIGPLLTQMPLSINVELLRAGRSATQLMATVTQQGKTCAVAQACFGIERSSKISITDKMTHAMSLPKKSNFLPQIPKVVPKFLRHFEFNLQAGRWPFMRGKKDHLYGWMRYKKKPSDFTNVHLIAAIDAWPCTVLQQMKMPSPASTMNWNLEFPQHASLPKTDDWMAYQAHTVHASDGYVFSNAEVWNQGGSLLASSRQTVGVFG